MGAVAHIDDYKKGHYFKKEARGNLSWNGWEHNVLLRNEGTDETGTPQFTDVAMAVGADDVIDSRGIALFDMDHDGDLDLAISHNPGDLHPEGITPGLLRNDIGQERNWLAVSLQGTQSNRDGIGAEVTLAVDKARYHRLVSAGSSYASQHSRRLYFGLDQATRVDVLTVRWPGGKEETFENINANQLVVITEGKGMVLEELPKLAPRVVSTKKNPPVSGGPR